MLDKQTTVINPEDQTEKKFTFDYSYWSHDGEKTLSDGYNESAGDGAVCSCKEQMQKCSAWRRTTFSPSSTSPWR